MYNLFDVVKLKEDNARLGIPSSAIGAIVDILDNGHAYTVEFIDENGDTYENSLFTDFKEDELEIASK